MPKIQRATEQQKLFAEELRQLYGGALTLAQVGKTIGARSKDTQRAWTKDVPYVMINGRKKWLVSDVAKKICDSRVEP